MQLRKAFAEKLKNRKTRGASEILLRERRRALCGAAVMTAAAALVSAAVAAVPASTGAVSPAAAANAIALQQGDLSDFYKNDALVTFTLPEVEAQSERLRLAFRPAPLIAAKTDFSACVSAVPRAELESRAAEIREAQRKKQAEDDEIVRQAMQTIMDAISQAEQATAAPQPAPQAVPVQTVASQTALLPAGGYVGLNTLGIPMSEMAGEVALDANGVPLYYSRVITGIATAYTNDPITSTGTVPIQGTVAVDPSIIPYGTRMWITSADGLYVYGLAVAEDTGGFIYLSNAPKADLYMYSEADCDEWGWRDAVIYILD